MAKTAAEIYLDYSRAISQANELDRIASQLDSLANNSLENSLRQVSSNWKGENADGYIRKGHTLKTNIGNSAKNVRKVADTIRRIARTTRDSELRALALASAKT